MKVLILAYLLCCYFSYKYIQKSYSKGGQWEQIDAKFEDIIVMLLPVFNLLLTCDYFFKSYRKHNQISLNKFFKVLK